MESIRKFRLQPADFHSFGNSLSRPECIIATVDGSLFVSDRPGGIVRIDQDGKQTKIGNIQGLPNGHAMDLNGDFLVTDIENGRLWQVRLNGTQEIVLDNLDGEPLGAVNFVMVDREDVKWITVSTRTYPRADSLSTPRPDGYIVKLDSSGPKIVADGFYFTNEARFDRLSEYLYVAETTQGRIVRLPLYRNGQLGQAEIFGRAPLFLGARTDGIAFDQEGNLWVTEITRNGIYVITPEGQTICIFEDPDGKILRVPTGITFAGKDLSTAYIGSLTMDRLLQFQSPIPGEPLAHWRKRDEKVDLACGH
jgi:gluconolactonase